MRTPRRRKAGLKRDARRHRLAKGGRRNGTRPSRAESLFNSLREKASIQGDILSPVLPVEAWETVKEWRELAKLDEANPVGAAKKRLRPRQR
jgi:hypothetical protein